MRFNYALTMIISFSVLFFINPDSTYSQEPVGEDERIIIAVDTVERYNSFPKSLKQPPRPGYKTRYKSPKRGNDYVVIYFPILAELKEFKYTKAQLIDDKDEIHNALQHTLHSRTNATGTIESTPHGEIFFEMPKDVTPVHMKYYYKNEDESEGLQEIKIEH